MAHVLSLTGNHFSLRIEYHVGPQADDLIDGRDPMLSNLLSSFREMNAILLVNLCRMQKVGSVYTMTVVKQQGDELVFDTDHALSGQTIRVTDGNVTNLLVSEIELIQTVRLAMVAIVDKYKATLIEFVRSA